MMNLGLSSSSDVIAFDQNWHHLYLTSAGGRDLSNDAQIIIIIIVIIIIIIIIIINIKLILCIYNTYAHNR